ncbi:MAG: flagellar hook-length control protein FliK [Gammaproteobacteria bacterium]|nr:MAG: flagellar hook-length control protein FliK [Gammaproteobacteria bacterium]
MASAPDPRGQTPAHLAQTPAPANSPQPVAHPHGRPEFHVSQSPLQPGWGEAMMARVSWQVAGGVQEARFHIHPPELGPVDVKVNVSREQASVQFLAHHVAVRDALEEALPRLREMLGANGLQLGQASISHHAPQDGGRGHGGAGAGGDGWRGESSWGSGGEGLLEGEGVRSGTVPVRLPSGLVDAYA